MAQEDAQMIRHGRPDSADGLWGDDAAASRAQVNTNDSESNHTSTSSAAQTINHPFFDRHGGMTQCRRDRFGRRKSSFK